ncbi:hypothetical protein BDA99DRAFT_523517 [Phascolomyces articulosus]|uniref:THIF-type NAD/FAD binding fold domain-containing protein n=1 Tax=Phascolomyces articulosus TaxID=60185 RepID=A0AAD5PAW2_9FUNG|nr:hypothetical protein BDA99DRAFT_523517 [Phascolomyces articulosus]
MTLKDKVEQWVDTTTELLDRHSNAVQMTLTAVAASALTASAILSYQASQRRFNSKVLKRQLDLQESNTPTIDLTASISTMAHGSSSMNGSYDEALIDEQLARNIAFLGEQGVDQVRRSFVIVVGAGSVGSWVALMLLRSGVQHLRLIDPKRLNRRNMAYHAVANLEDVGSAKVQVLQKHFKEIAPFSKVECCTERLLPANMDTLLGGRPAYVVDTIDNIDEKLAIAQYCHKHQIKLISSMGAGAKADPTRIQISDISDTFEDPLARVYRRRLKMLKIDRGIPIALSIEKPLPEDPQDSVLSPVADFRSRNLPILGPIPSMFGMTIATFILLQLADFTALPPPPTRLKDNLFGRIHYDVSDRERKTYKNFQPPLDVHEVIYIFEELWHAKSILTGPQDRLTLARWDRSKPMTSLNTVCMSRDEARAHDALAPDTDLRKYYGDDVVDYVNKQFKLEQEFQKFWN